MQRNSNRAWAGIFIAFLLFITWGCGKNEIIEVGKQALAKNTTWSGIVLVNGDVYVPPGVTLTISPGTIVKFKKIDSADGQNMFGVDPPYFPQTELIVCGQLIAKGSRRKPITFTSAERTGRPGDWGAVNILGSEGNNVVEYVSLSYADTGIHALSSTVYIAFSKFAKNRLAISCKRETELQDAPWFDKDSSLIMDHNLVVHNRGGIDLWNSRASLFRNRIRHNNLFGIWAKEQVEAAITKNEITGNGKGVYLTQARGMTLEYNNIYDNREYDIALAELQNFTVDARRNWFGTADPLKIGKMIFDGKDNPGLADIITVPFLEGPVDLED